MLSGISKGEYGGSVPIQGLESMIQETLDKSKYQTGKKGKDISAARDTLTGLLLQSGLLYEENGIIRSKYIFRSGKDFYRDILPLSGIEKRWILSILDDARISMFFRAAEIDRIRKVLKVSRYRR